MLIFKLETSKKYLNTASRHNWSSSTTKISFSSHSLKICTNMHHSPHIFTAHSNIFILNLISQNIPQLIVMTQIEVNGSGGGVKKKGLAVEFDLRMKVLILIWERGLEMDLSCWSIWFWAEEEDQN